MKQLKDGAFDVNKFTDRTLFASERALRDYTGDSLEPIPLLYQAGYLTIVDFDREVREYTLAFPNDEVKYGFLESLMPVRPSGKFKSFTIERNSQTHYTIY